MKSKRRPLSIKWKFFLSLLLFAGVLLLLLWLLQVVFLESFYKFYKTREIRRTAEVVAENIDDGQIGSLLEQISRQQGISAAIVDPQDMTVLRRQEGLGREADFASQEQLQLCYEKAWENGGTYLAQKQGSVPGKEHHFSGWVPPGQGMLETILCATLVDSQQGERLVVLTSQITPVGSTVEALRAELVCISAILLVFALVLALWVSRKVTGPIVRINQAAKELGKGRFDVNFGSGGYREIDELSATMTEAAEALGRQDHLRRELLANVSHDLRTPLTMIIGYAEAIRDLPGEDTPENLQVIADEATRLSELVTDLLDLSKLQAQVEPLQRQRFCLTDSIQSTLDRLQKMSSIQLCFRWQQEAWVQADELRLSQVVYNLVGNAMAHTGADRRVDVIQTVGDGRVRIQVRDTGEGIPPEEQDLIWERYYKNSKNNHRPGSGTGLGLAIAKAVLEQHGAQFGVKSRPKQGSTFWFELPCA